MAVALAFLIGLAIGGGLYVMRRHFWSVLNALGLAGSILLGTGVVVIVGFLVLSMGKSGGDAAMNAMTFLVFFGLVVVACMIISAIFGAVQAKRLHLPIGHVMRTLFLDCVALGIAVYALTAIFYTAPVKSNSRQAMDQEMQRREKVKELKAKLPLEYHENAAMMLQIQRQQEEMMRRSGRPMVESKADQLAPIVNEYVRLREQTSTTPLSFYQDLNELQRKQRIYLGVGWLVGALLLPLALPGTKQKIAD